MTVFALLAAASLTMQSPQTTVGDSAVLRVGTRPVAVLRGMVGAASPAERAERATARIMRQLATSSADSVATAPLADGVMVTIGGQPMFVLLPSDIDTAGGETMSASGQQAELQLRVAVAEHREGRALRKLTTAAALSLTATMLLVLLVRVILRARQALLTRGRARAVGLPGWTLVRADQVERAWRTFVTALAWIAGLILVDIYATFVLKRFPWTRPWGEAADQWLLATAGGLLKGVLRAVPGLLIVALIFFGVRLATKVVGALFGSVAQGRATVPFLHPETAEPTRRITVAMLWLLGVVVAYPYLPGSGTEAFKGVSVFAGLLLTLGSSGVVNQAMSGLTVMYARALRVGDFVRLGDTEGTVTQVGMLSTKIRTVKHVEVTIPSSVVLGQSILNYTRLREERGGVILLTSVTIGYDTPWRQVHGLLLNAAAATAGLKSDRAPFVLQTALSDWYVEYELNVWFDEPETKPAVLSALHANIQDQFNTHGVQIMSPHYLADKNHPVVVSKEHWYAPPARPDSGGA